MPPYREHRSSFSALKRSPLLTFNVDRRSLHIPRSKLDPIQENSSTRTGPFFGLNLDEHHDFSDKPEDSPLFLWDDEKTLVADLMHADSDDNVKDEQRLLSLIESIQPAFELESQELLTDVASVLVPAVERVKQAHHRLGTSVDATFRSGMDNFDAGCQATEARAIKQHDEISTVYLASQARLGNLFDQLKETFVQRDNLWADLERFLQSNFQPVNHSLEELPREMETLLIGLEKQSKQLLAGSGTEKMIKDLLAKFT